MYSDTKFFLGANSNIGFISYFKQLQEQNSSMQLLILKGGPGSGKSSLMKRVASYAEKQGHKLEIIACASDPASLDAIIDYTADFAMMDGTAPHVEDPILPGAQQHIMYTGDLWDSDRLRKNKDLIEKLSASIGACHSGAGAYIKAAAALLSENMGFTSRYFDKDAADKLIMQAADILPKGGYSKEKTRLLSAVSVGEITFFESTVSALAENIYIIEDNHGFAADYILKGIRNIASLKKAKCIHCPCSIMPDKTDHLIFPDISTAFVTQNSFLRFSHGKLFSTTPLYRHMPLMPQVEERLSCSQKLLEKAAGLVKDAKLLHDKLEEFYVKAMDFSKTDGLFEEIIKRFYN